MMTLFSKMHKLLHKCTPTCTRHSADDVIHCCHRDILDFFLRWAGKMRTGTRILYIFTITNHPYMCTKSPYVHTPPIPYTQNLPGLPQTPLLLRSQSNPVSSNHSPCRESETGECATRFGVCVCIRVERVCRSDTPTHSLSLSPHTLILVHNPTLTPTPISLLPSHWAYPPSQCLSRVTRTWAWQKAMEKYLSLISTAQWAKNLSQLEHTWGKNDSNFILCGLGEMFKTIFDCTVGKNVSQLSKF